SVAWCNQFCFSGYHNYIVYSTVSKTISFKCLASLFSMYFSQLVFICFFRYARLSYFVVGLMLALFIPTTVWLKITSGIATSSVIILNLYSAGHIPLSFLGDQFLLISVGIGTALLFNLYMPSLDKHLIAKQKQLEHN